jgi:hypothetical protein
VDCRWAGIFRGVCSHSTSSCHALSPILVSKLVSGTRQISPANSLLYQFNKTGILGVSRHSRVIRAPNFRMKRRSLVWTVVIVMPIFSGSTFRTTRNNENPAQQVSRGGSEIRQDELAWQHGPNRPD